ncbi:MAG: hypothetical protein EBS56_09230 [Planctomycetia bacterium]|nr:hypothetical protein [Planctomycetia bacterium]
MGPRPEPGFFRGQGRRGGGAGAGGGAPPGGRDRPAGRAGRAGAIGRTRGGDRPRRRLPPRLPAGRRLLGFRGQLQRGCRHLCSGPRGASGLSGSGDGAGRRGPH